jgi:uncharacterized protein
MVYGCSGGGIHVTVFPTSTPTPTLPPTSTPWVPPTALAGTPIPGAEATLTAAPSLKRISINITNSKGQNVAMNVEVAGDEPSRELGLMFRPSMPPDAGMLFDFGQDTTESFWMENTILPLSIAFIEKSGNILSIQDMKALDQTSIVAPGPYRYALETNQGFFNAHDIVPGNHVTIAIAQSVVIPGMPSCAGH